MNNVILDPKSHDGRIIVVVVVVPPPPLVDVPGDHFHLDEQVAVVVVVHIISLALIKLMHGYHQRKVGGVVVVVEVVLVDVMHEEHPPHVDYGVLLKIIIIGHLVPLRLHLIHHQQLHRRQQVMDSRHCQEGMQIFCVMWKVVDEGNVNL